MKTTIYSTHKFDRPSLQKANDDKHDIQWLDVRLTEETAALAQGSEAVCLFAGDDASASVLKKLKEAGIKYIALRSAGFNHVDLKRANELGIKVARVPAYSPYSIAEHATALILALNRKIIRAHRRVMEMNFLLDGLTGFDLNGKTAGIIGVGKIGAVLVRILHGFGCRILAHDLVPNAELQEKYELEYVSCEKLCAESDIISLHVPLTASTHYIINQQKIDRMKKGVMFINTSRGGLVDTESCNCGPEVGAHRLLWDGRV